MKLYDFWADWCGPCKLMDPVIKEMELKYPWLEVIRINADENRETCEDYDVRGIPTYILFDENDEFVARKQGAMPKRDFENWLLT